MDFNKDYTQHKAADFATDDLFRAWVFENDSKIHAFWRYFLLENPDQTNEIEDARKLLKAVWASQPSISEAEIDRELVKIQGKLNASTMIEKQPIRIVSLKRYSTIGIAAAVSLLIAIGLWFFHEKKQAYTEGGQSNVIQLKKEADSESKAQKRETVNEQQQPLSITLNDGSVVTLEHGSKLIYPEKFEADKREVTLEGEAFFEVVKNPAKPFLVYARNVRAKVLGTSFRIRAFDKNVQVMVKTGKVAVFTQNNEKESESEKQAIVLTPNQQVAYQSSSNRFNKSVQEVPTLLTTSVKIRDLHFDDAPVATVFNALKDAYGIEIIYDEDVLKNCTLTTSLTDEPLFEKLTIICKTIGATYRELDAKIIVTGRGCK